MVQPALEDVLEVDLTRDLILAEFSFEELMVLRCCSRRVCASIAHASLAHEILVIDPEMWLRSRAISSAFRNATCVELTLTANVSEREVQEYEEVIDNLQNVRQLEIYGTNLSGSGPAIPHPYRNKQIVQRMVSRWTRVERLATHFMFIMSDIHSAIISGFFAASSEPILKIEELMTEDQLSAATEEGNNNQSSDQSIESINEDDESIKKLSDLEIDTPLGPPQFDATQEVSRCRNESIRQLTLTLGWEKHCEEISHWIRTCPLDGVVRLICRKILPEERDNLRPAIEAKWPHLKSGNKTLIFTDCDKRVHTF